MASKIDGTNGLIQNYIYLDGSTSPSITPSATFTYTVPSGVQNVILNPSGTVTQTVTITLPASAVDGMTVSISTTQQLNLFTVSGSVGQSVSGSISGTPLQAKTSVSYVYNSTKSTWYPFTAISPYILPAPSTSGNLLTSDGTIWNSTAASGIAAGIGVGQTWTDVSASRSVATTYTNSTGKPIAVSVLGGQQTAAVLTASISVNGVVVNSLQLGANANGTAGKPSAFAIVPPAGTYLVSLSGGISAWYELR